MYSIISGSNRKGNRTLPFAQYIYDGLSKRKTATRLLDLTHLSGELVYDTMYHPDTQPEYFQQLQQEQFIPTEKFWFFVPEYNGSYPGVIKILLDSMSTVDRESTFQNKKVMLTGIASGRAGNLRGMDHLADVLNHLGMHVHPNKKPISSIYRCLDKENVLVDDKIKGELDAQMEDFINY